MSHIIEIAEKLQEDDTEEKTVLAFTCEICSESISLNKKFKNKDAVCDHPFCIDCIAKYIQVKVKDGVANVECPGVNCDQFLDLVTCRPIIPNTVLDKWCDRLCDWSLLELERCYCPNLHCSAPVVNECGGIVKRAECPNCKKLFCFRCKLSWHEGYRCDQSHVLRDENDVLFGQLIETNKWARCPSCGQCVERIDGCSSVVCRCKTLFCVTCGKKLNKDHCRCAPWTWSWYNIMGVIILLPILLPIALVMIMFEGCQRLYGIFKRGARGRGFSE